MEESVERGKIVAKAKIARVREEGAKDSCVECAVERVVVFCPDFDLIMIQILL